MSVVLTPVTDAAAAAIRAGEPLPDLTTPDDYPTEFSVGVAEAAEEGQALGPFFIQDADDGVVVGEIGGAITEAGTAEIGYAVVDSCAGRGYATGAVRRLVALAQDDADIERLVAHAPVERPASSRVLEKAGFTSVGEREDEHEGEVLRVQRWELVV